ncbi:hypothetical protein IT774_12880 [Salinimonas marina]|uniref:HDOD domain-containing protein n=1 Tax=Salinimonas marina TaxID=2785918 RepID=A0A7S9DWI4_9ALTE|nr:hypothetical protein [Salinimonas marina]QPG05028.1 hypothetical protein IT774_12880 [Salinimonas marina]
MVESAYNTLLQQSQRASAALIRQGSLLNVARTGLSMGKQIVEFARHHPQAALVAVNAIRQESSLTHPLPLKTALMTAILGLRTQLNDHYLQHLTGATFTLFTAATYHRDTRTIHFDTTVLQGLKKHLTGPQLGLWRTLFAVSKVVGQPNFYRYLQNPAINYPQWWMICCAHLSVHFSFSFFEALRPVALASPSAYEPIIRSWLTFPGDYWPGGQAADDNGKHTIVFKTQSHYALSCGAQTEALNWQASVPRPPIHYIRFAQWCSLHDAAKDDQQQINAFKFEGRRYPVSHPPAAILNIVSMLRNNDVNINKLSDQVQLEPAFAEALKQSAAMDNRLKLPVKEVKQAILTYGTERVGDMLVLEALMQRLNQHYFPLGRCCQNLLVVSANLASLIAAQVNSRLSSQGAALVSSFALAPIFSLPALKVLPRLPHHEYALHNINTLLRLKSTDSMVDYAARLAANWHQPALHQAIIRQFGKEPDQASPGVLKEFAIISLSLLLSRKWLLVPGEMDPDSIRALRQCLQLLGLKPAVVSELQNSVSALLTSPLPYRL